MNTNTYDVVIIGGACAGLAAATYSSRRAMSTLVITKDIGGQIATTTTVENYPGIDHITGPELGIALQNQAVRWGAEITYDEATAIAKNPDDTFTVTGNMDTYTGRSIILAYGKTPRNLNVPGEKQYTGKGVCYCATCDAPLYRNRAVAVVGGGNSGMDGALLLSKMASKVYLIHQKETLSGEATLVEKILSDPKIELLFSTEPLEILGDGQYVTGMKVGNLLDKQERTLQVDGVFVEVGYEVKVDLVKELVEIDRFKQVITNKKMETSAPGIFAAGDLTDSPYKQAVISAGEGATAALTAYAYIANKPNAGVDWSAHPSKAAVLY